MEDELAAVCPIQGASPPKRFSKDEKAYLLAFAVTTIAVTFAGHGYALFFPVHVVTVLGMTRSVLVYNGVVFMAAYFFTSVLLVAIGNMLNPRSMLIISQFGIGVACFLFPQFVTVAWFCTIIAAEGIFTAMYSTSVGWMTSRIFSNPNEIPIVSGVETAATSLTTMLAATVGGLLYSLCGYHVPFYAFGSAVFLSAVVSIVLLPAAPSGDDHSPPVQEANCDAIRNVEDPGDVTTAGTWLRLFIPGLAVNLATTFIAWSEYYALDTIYVQHMSSYLRVSIKAALHIVMIMFPIVHLVGIVQTWAAVRFAVKLGNVTCMAVGCVLGGCGWSLINLIPEPGGGQPSFYGSVLLQTVAVSCMFFGTFLKTMPSESQLVIIAGNSTSTSGRVAFGMLVLAQSLGSSGSLILPNLYMRFTGDENLNDDIPETFRGFSGVVWGFTAANAILLACIVLTSCPCKNASRSESGTKNHDLLVELSTISKDAS